MTLELALECKSNILSSLIGERAKRARHFQVCSIENRILLASERSERDTLRSVQLRIVDIYIIYYGTCKFCSYNP